MNEPTTEAANKATKLAELSVPQVRIRATTVLAGFFLLSLVIPTMSVLPAGFGALNRTLEEFWDFAVIGAWLFLFITGATQKVAIRPAYLRWSLWVLPIAVTISVFFRAFNGYPTLNDVYAILFALRPIAIIQITGFLLWFGHVGERGIHRAIDLIFVIVGIVLAYVSLVAILQALRVSVIFQFVERFYGNEILFQGEMIQRSLQAIEYYNRTTSIFPWANHYGTYTAVSLLLLFHYFLYTRWMKRYLLAIPMLLGVVGLVLSGSRTAFIILFLGIFLTILIRRQFRLLPLLAFGAVLVVIAFSYSSLILGSNPRVVEIVDYLRGEAPVPKTFTDRFNNYDLWLSGTYYDKGNPITGITTGVFDSIRETQEIKPFDNEYLKNFILFGGIGLIAFILLELGLITYTWRTHLRNNLRSPAGFLASTLFTIYVPLSIAAMVQDTWQLAKVIYLLFVPLGVLLYIIKPISKATPPVPVERTP